VALIILAHQILPRMGGTERYIYELACALQDCGEELVVIATDCEGATDFDSRSPLTIKRIPAKSKWQAVQALAAAGTAYAEGNNSLNQPVTAIIAEKWWPAGLAGWLIRRHTGLPYVVIAHDCETVRVGTDILKCSRQPLRGQQSAVSRSAGRADCRGIRRRES